jgi:hypothetical protein
LIPVGDSILIEARYESSPVLKFLGELSRKTIGRRERKKDIIIPSRVAPASVRGETLAVGAHDPPPPTLSSLPPGRADG